MINISQVLSFFTIKILGKTGLNRLAEQKYEQEAISDNASSPEKPKALVYMNQISIKCSEVDTEKELVKKIYGECGSGDFLICYNCEGKRKFSEQTCKINSGTTRGKIRKTPLQSVRVF